MLLQSLHKLMYFLLNTIQACWLSHYLFTGLCLTLCPCQSSQLKKITYMPPNAFLGGVPKKVVGTLPNPELFQDIQIFTTCHKIVTKLCAPEKIVLAISWLFQLRILKRGVVSQCFRTVPKTNCVSVVVKAKNCSSLGFSTSSSIRENQ